MTWETRCTEIGIQPQRLHAFVCESNNIEGIIGTNDAELNAHLDLIVGTLTITALNAFVQTVQPHATLRKYEGMNVDVGNHVPRPGGVIIECMLRDILEDARDDNIHPYNLHHRYETLHPYMDGNGRSGRALWLAHMFRRYGPDVLLIPFLQRWYYQSLEFNDAR